VPQVEPTERSATMGRVKVRVFLREKRLMCVFLRFVYGTPPGAGRAAL
jgi:hypothetical protein